jgi:mannose-6-phosphate isomerase
MFKIEGVVKSYEWGKLGKESIIYQLLESQKNQDLNPELCYAELWFGDHPSGISKLKKDDSLISSKITLESLTPLIYEKYKSLPFLFKILSIRKPLSIQAHPDKQLAIKLNSKFPLIYKDNNHKPEMALALSKFKALVGFRPLKEILNFIQEYPELEFIKSNNDLQKVSDEKLILKQLFETLMKSNQDIISNQLELLLKRFKSKENPNEIESLFLWISTLYPNNIGLFCIFFLNYVELEPSQGIYLGANEPHAYLLGECVECMATSDNVVRAGLTPKFKDVDTLISMLTYNTCEAKKQILYGETFKSTLFTKLYNPPIEEFSILRTQLSLNQIENLGSIKGPSIMILLKGKAMINQESFNFGEFYFINANTEITLKSLDSDTIIFTAFCDLE